jgi:hypothetical protein
MHFRFLLEFEKRTGTVCVKNNAAKPRSSHRLMIEASDWKLSSAVNFANKLNQKPFLFSRLKIKLLYENALSEVSRRAVVHLIKLDRTIYVSRLKTDLKQPNFLQNG